MCDLACVTFGSQEWLVILIETILMIVEFYQDCPVRSLWPLDDTNSRLRSRAAGTMEH